MCGIFGYWQMGGDLIESSAIHQATTLLQHRGPDDEGYLLVTPDGHPTLWGGNQTPEELHLPHINRAGSMPFCLAFGHRRLSIIDLSPAGHQPMSYANGRLWITYNGEIYNYIEVRHELAAKGYAFESESDTEVILAAYHCWGADALSRFNGMFALAIWDNENHTLFCARDRLGIKPFYYYFDRNIFVFSSEIKAILSVVASSREVNYPILAHFLVRGSLDFSEQTFFANIKSLSSAHYIVINQSTQEIKTQRYWCVEPEEISSRYDFHHPKETFLSLLNDSIKLRLRSDVPVGTCLSGGLDSSTILALASSQLPHPIHSFSSVYLDPAYNEKPYIEIISKQCKSLSHYSSPDPNDFFEILPQIIWHMDEPSAGPGVYSQWFVMELANTSVKVLLDGQGGDELFAGYYPYLPLYMKSLFYSFFSTLNPVVLNRLIRDAITIFRDTRQYFFPELTFKPFWSKVSARISGQRYSGDFLLPDISGEIPRVSSKQRDSVFSKDIVNQVLHQDITTNILPALLHYEDRNGMAFGVETRVPLLDHRVVEFALGIPGHEKIRGSTTKYFMRESLTGILPEPIRARRDKKGYPTPFAVWLRNSLKQPTHELLSNHFNRRNIYNVAVANRMWNQHLNGAADYSTQIFRWLAAELWFQQFVDRDPAEG